MSADNWAICPKCQKTAEDTERHLKAKVQSEYGKMPLDKWLALKAESDTPTEKLEQTLREDYEIGIDGSTFSVSYRSGCNVCGFSFSYKDEKMVSAIGKGSP